MPNNRPSTSKIPSPRPEITNSSRYSAPLEGRRKLLRLDFNENTMGPSPKVLEALKNIPSHYISIYPEYNGLKEAMASNLNKKEGRTNILSTHIGVFNGVDAAIHAIFNAYGNKDDILLTTKPTFGYYSPCAKMQGMKIIEIPHIKKDFTFPIEQITQSLRTKEPKLLFICNPNNPTGTSINPEEIINLSKSSRDTLIVVDELYEAFTNTSILPIIDFRKTPNIVVLRSLSKTAGLAGLRIGFCIGNPDVIDIIESVTGPYDVNSFAVTAAFAALKDQQYIDNYVLEVLKARDWLCQKLIENKVKYHIKDGNYCLIWPNKSASLVEESLKKEGILVRNMSNKPFLNGALRVSIGTTSQMKIFWGSFRKIDIKC